MKNNDIFLLSETFAVAPLHDPPRIPEPVYTTPFGYDPASGSGCLAEYHWNGTSCVLDDEPVCGFGTSYQKGMCVVDKTAVHPVESSENRWGYGMESPAVLDCDVNQIYNQETQTCDVRVNSTDIFISAFVIILISCLVVYRVWRKRK